MWQNTNSLKAKGLNALQYKIHKIVSNLYRNSNKNTRIYCAINIKNVFLQCASAETSDCHCMSGTVEPGLKVCQGSMPHFGENLGVGKVQGCSCCNQIPPFGNLCQAKGYLYPDVYGNHSV